MSFRTLIAVRPRRSRLLGSLGTGTPGHADRRRQRQHRIPRMSLTCDGEASFPPVLPLRPLACAVAMVC